MKIPSFALLATSVVALLLASCSGEDYDPAAANPDPTKARGKVIEGKVASKQTSVEKTPAPLEIDPFATPSSQEVAAKIDPPAPSEPLVGQTLPPIDPAAPDPAPPAPPESKLPPLPKDSPYKEVSFRSISSFPYEVEWETDGKEPDPTAYLQRVPREVRKLGGAKVAVEGFMIPTMVNEDNKVTEFLLLPDQMSCCYGKNPAANGWVVVTSQGTDIMMDQMIRVTGSLVVEERWDEEFFVGLYHLSCENVTGPAL